MTNIRTNKVDAARRQIDVAIRLLFNNEDPIAIHTLAAAGSRILRDLCETKGTPFDKIMKAIIAPGKEKEVRKLMNRPANFFKHADEDPDETLEFDDSVNDITLLMAVSYYGDLGNALTPEMRLLEGMCFALHPNLLNDHIPSHIRKPYLDCSWLQTIPRTEQLKYMKEALKKSHRNKMLI